MRVIHCSAAATFLLLTTVPSLGCHDGPTAPSTGTIEITVTTTGTDIDPDGYSLRLDGGPLRPVGVNGAVTIPALASGTHFLRLDGLMWNCSVTGDNPKTVDVVGHDVIAPVAFTVSCLVKGEEPNPWDY